MFEFVSSLILSSFKKGHCTVPKFYLSHDNVILEDELFLRFHECRLTPFTSFYFNKE